MVAVSDVVPRVAVIVAEVLADTLAVDTTNVALEAPPATCTVDGTVALELFDDRLTVKPPDGATLLRVTVPVTEAPPKTEFGAMDKPERLTD